MFEAVTNCGAGKFISSDEWIHPDRTIDSHEIIFVTKGIVYINDNGNEYALGPDELLLLEPNVRHFGYKKSTNTEFFWLHFKSNSNTEYTFKHIKAENPYTLSLYCREMLDALVLSKPHETLDYLTRLILVELSINTGNQSKNPAVEKIAAWIKANNNIPVTETQIADIFGYNTDYINRIFKASFKKTIKQYINEERIKYIKTLMLYDNLPLKEVAIKSGFTEYKYFLKFFKYHEKVTPTEFYRQFSKIHINSR